MARRVDITVIAHDMARAADAAAMRRFCLGQYRRDAPACRIIKLAMTLETKLLQRAPKGERITPVLHNAMRHGKITHPSAGIAKHHDLIAHEFDAGGGTCHT